MEPIRVLHVVGNMNAGGMETLIMNWYRSVDRSVVQFDFLTNTTKQAYFEQEILSMGGRIYPMSFMDDKNFGKYIRDLRAFFAEHREFLVVHGHHAALGRFYLKEARRAGVPCCISHAHTASYSKNLRGYVKHLTMRGYGKFATHRFACSRAAGKYMYGKNVEYTLVNNGIDTVSFAFSEEKRASKRAELGIVDKRVLVHVGRFDDPKNHSFLVEIFDEVYKRDRNSVLLLVGDGPLRAGIEAKVSAMASRNAVRFMGLRSDVGEILSASDLMLFPSLWEGLPLTLVEAQAAGLSIVCSTAVTDETRLTEHYRSLSLSDPTDVWAETVLLESAKTIDRVEACRVVREKKYDCSMVAREMQDFYLEQARIARQM